MQDYDEAKDAPKRQGGVQCRESGKGKKKGTNKSAQPGRMRRGEGAPSFPVDRKAGKFIRRLLVFGTLKL
jgi:hypothetical protein